MNKVKRIAALTAVVILLAWHKSKFYVEEAALAGALRHLRPRSGTGLQ